MGNRRSTSPRPILLIPQMLTLTIALEFVSRACGATATSTRGSSGRVAFDAVVEAIIPQLAIERRAPDPQRSRHPRHAATIVAESEGDKFALEIGQCRDLAPRVEKSIGNRLSIRFVTLPRRSRVDMNGG